MAFGAFREGAFGVCAGVIMTTMLMLLSAEITLRLLCRLYFYSSSRKVKNRQGCLSASAIIGHVRGGGWGGGADSTEQKVTTR